MRYLGLFTSVPCSFFLRHVPVNEPCQKKRDQSQPKVTEEKGNLAKFSKRFMSSDKKTTWSYAMEGLT
jgi:hypothetical protein